MSSRIDKILELLDNPTQRQYPATAEEQTEALAEPFAAMVEIVQRFGEAIKATGISIADLLAALQQKPAQRAPWKRNKHFGYGR